MRVLSICAAICVMLCVAGLVQASVNTGDLVKITDGPGNGPGGSFVATDLTAPVAPAFQTFCLERNETFSLGGTYYVTIEDKAIFGGNGVADIGGAGSAGTLGVSDPLSPLTAWLYRNAVAGTLTGYSANVAGDNDALQDAIWYIENESALPAGLATTFYNAAVAAAPTTIGLVRVMNLWADAASAYTQDGKKQSMLVLVPEASTIAVWSILTLVGAGVAYRKHAK